MQKEEGAGGDAVRLRLGSGKEEQLRVAVLVGDRRREKRKIKMILFETGNFVFYG